MELIVGIVLIVLFILLLRLFGAWMLRIDEVIENQKTQILTQERLINGLHQNNTNQEVMISIFREIIAENINPPK